MSQMRLSQFILANKEKILSEWETFARSLLPASQAMNIEELRDHADGILTAITKDLERPQTDEEQADKAKGKSHSGSGQFSEATAHGAVRAGTGFTLPQMVSEFRALRASVLRLWREETGERAMDVDEITRFNEAIDQALAESSGRFAEDLERSADLFLGIVGHDLQNPLGAIMMSASQLLRQVEAEGSSGKTASRIMRSSIRMKEILGDLLDFTRTRLGTGIPIVRAPVDLEETCRDTVEEVAALFPNSALHLEMSGDLTGDWDECRLGQALSNLIGNAVKHGAKKAPITVSARGGPGDVVLSVHNWGPAIPKKEFGEIFLPLKRAEVDPAVPGLGLGLFITKEIITAHGGRIEVESTKAYGTTFTIHLPRSARPTDRETPEPHGSEAPH